MTDLHGTLSFLLTGSELRAATSLARLWVRQGKGAAAREMVEETLRQGDRPAGGVDARAAESLIASLS